MGSRGEPKTEAGVRAAGMEVGCGPRLTPKRRGGRSRTANPGAPRKEAGLEPGHFQTEKKTASSAAVAPAAVGTGRPRCAAQSRGAPTLPAPGPCVPEVAACLSSTPSPSPTPPADPRRAAGLQKAGPSAACCCLSDICSSRGERLRSSPLAAPETAEGEGERGGGEPSGAERSQGPEGAARRQRSSSGLTRERGGGGEATACFGSPVLTVGTCKDRQNLGKSPESTAGNRGIHRDAVGS